MKMISNRIRDSRRGRPFKMPKNLERLYKEGKCVDCSVVVTRMDFAKILGKFTKVKIQYESSSTSKTKNTSSTSPNSNARLKSNENGMVLIHRNAYSQHPVKEIVNTNKLKGNAAHNTRANSTLKENSRGKGSSTPRQINNILKENNRLKKKTPQMKKSDYYIDQKHSNIKHYGIIFVNPSKNNNADQKNKMSLSELLPHIDRNILPSGEWIVDFLPTDGEPKEDKVYDRIAAELEDLMYSETPSEKNEAKVETTESKVDDFPSIMDILNDSTADNTTKLNNQSNNSIEIKSNLDSSDVEAMLLGKPNETSKVPESTPMDVDNAEVADIIDDVVQLNATKEAVSKLPLPGLEETDIIDNPHSPSILDVTLQKGVEEYLPASLSAIEDTLPTASSTEVNTSRSKAMGVELDVRKDSDSKTDMENKQNNNSIPNVRTITHVVFKKCTDGKCYKSVTCPKNLKYSIELEGKSVQFVGAPKFISSLEDLQVLLQIVNESELDSLHVLC